MLLVPVPWAGRVWALPFLSILAPSERYATERGKQHKKITDWARQALLLVRRWWPEREIVAVADSAYASLRLLASCRRFLPKAVTFVTRLRLDAALYDPAPLRRAGQIGRPRLKGERLPNLSAVAEDPSTAWTPTTVDEWYGSGERTVEVASATAVWYSTGLPAVPIRWVLVRDTEGEFATQALLCTDLAARPEQILGWFVLGWQIETTFQEARRHLGIETQRQWSEMAIRPAHHPGAFGLVLTRNPLRPPTNGAEHRSRPASGVVPQTLPDFLRCFGAGEKGVVGTGDFSRLVLGVGHGKSAASVRGAANRNALLCGLNG
jgi:hypothetical protein